MHLHIGWPQLLYIAFVGYGLVRTLCEDETVSDLVGTTIAGFVLFGLLYWGGFFTN